MKKEGAYYEISEFTGRIEQRCQFRNCRDVAGATEENVNSGISEMWRSL
jgi:hypothetical protein